MTDIDKLAKQINAQVRGFYLDRGRIIKAMRYIKRDNVILFRVVSTGEEFKEEYRGSALFRKRIFTIGEVSKLVGRAVGTLRDYERVGLLPPAKRFAYSNGHHRYYTFEDVREIEDFFSSRRVGRPPKKRVYSHADVRDKLKRIKKGIR